VDVKLKIGDILQDTTSGDIGVLLRRYPILAETSERKDINIWVWDIYWVGKIASGSTNGIVQRLQPYTEMGLVNLISSKTFVINPEFPDNG
tara:strand:- start:3004 stop:3276 length:273 start_codon:yes stop_codon:yes gene_type:complete